MNSRSVAPSNEALDLILRRPVSTLDLPVRATSCLRRAGIETVGQLIQCSPVQLRRFRNLGTKLFRDITEALDREGLALLSKVDSFDPMTVSGEPAEVLLESVSRLNLSVRSTNCLIAKDITTIGQLISYSAVELLRLPNLGVKSLREISAALDQLGLALEMRLDVPSTAPAPIAHHRQVLSSESSSVSLIGQLPESMLPELEALAYLNRFPVREWAVLRNRILESRLTLEELGLQFNVTRERIRQLEKKLLRRLETYLGGFHSQYLHELAKTVQAELGTAIPICRLDVNSLTAQWPSLTSDDDRDRLIRFLMWVAGPYAEVAGWLTSAPGLVDRTAAELTDRLDSRGWLAAEVAQATLLAAGIHSEHHAAWLSHIGYKAIDEGWLPPRRTIPDKVEQILHYRNAPMTFDELWALIGSDSARSIRNRLLTDERFKKVSRQGHFALREWQAYDEYSGIATEISQEIGRQGGSTTIRHLIEVLTKRYGVKASSVYAYASAPMFVKESDGIVRLRRPDEPLEIQADPHSCLGLYSVEGQWVLRVDVTSETVRGSGRALQPAIAVLVGCQPGERREFPSPTDEIVISWPAGSAAGPYLGSLKPDVEALGGAEGDFVFLTLELARIDVRLVKARSLKDMTPWAELATMVGLSESVGSSVNVLAAIASAIGISEQRGCVDAEDIHARLMQRNEVALARVIGDQLPDASEDILNRLENMLGL